MAQCLYGHNLHKSKSQFICDECVNEGKIDRQKEELRLETIRKNSPLILSREDLKDKFKHVSFEDVEINHFKVGISDKIRYSNIVIFFR